jgi:hypothetical protein
MTSTGSDYNEWLDELDDDVRQLNYIDPGHIPDLIARARLAGEMRHHWACLCGLPVAAGLVTHSPDCLANAFDQLEAERKGEGDG